MGSATLRGQARNGRFLHFFPSKFPSKFPLKSWWRLLMTRKHELKMSTPPTYRVDFYADSIDYNIVMSDHKEERYLKYKMWIPKGILARYR